VERVTANSSAISDGVSTLAVQVPVSYGDRPPRKLGHPSKKGRERMVSRCRRLSGDACVDSSGLPLVGLR